MKGSRMSQVAADMLEDVTIQESALISQFLFQAILDAHADVKLSPVTVQEIAELDAQLPPPMLKNNWESLADRWVRFPLLGESTTTSSTHQRGLPVVFEVVGLFI